AMPLSGRRPNATQAAAAVRLESTASARSTRRRLRSKTTPSSVRVATTAAAAKAICTIVTSSTASGYAEQDERERQADNGRGERPQGPLGLDGKGLGGDVHRRAVDQFDAARNVARAAAKKAHRRRQAPLRMAE